MYAGKFLHASRDGDESATARFGQEARLLEGLSHPNLVRVDGSAIGVDDAGNERSFVRMELVEGCGLDVLVAREAPMPEARVAEFGRQLAEGLAYAHGHGIVHRDLKPANVLVQVGDAGADPVLKIADFGMARASSLSGVEAGALTVLGTPDYMAPESIEPLAVDARTDLYALGCMLFEMLTATVPFPAATPFGVLRRHREDPVPPLPADLSPAMRAIVQSLLAKSPADRPPSAGIVARRLAQIAAGESALALVGEAGIGIAESITSSCAGCGHPLVAHVAVCLNCGLASATLEAGSFGVVITGPGEVGDKMDAQLRQQLLVWLDQNPQLGLEGGKGLKQRIPRLPVVFVTRVSERSAKAMVASLAALGFAAEAISGAAIRHPQVRSKAGKLAGRVGLIAMTSMGGMFNNGVWVIGVLAVGAVGALIGTTVHSARSVTRGTGRKPDALGPELRAAFDDVEALVPTLDQPRHRHALRAVIRQVLALRKRIGAEQDEQLALALTRATATTGTLARIDRQLSEVDLNLADDNTRALLHQRDLWSGRMLELSGALEGLRARATATQLRAAEANDDGGLDDLRATVEALEEVQSL
ncbi:putative serine/threonine-protein kinase pknH [Enhygromyxa salina]|uniref:Putative serine/threonine-protein kinase pknH n=1 Tax=Enhygromyxa salina TaxID=215803 RepID=A0A0C2DBY4_9BACT|nr:putative serine/threonine-protein kinase pknH [Enhygromyxa salina]